MLIDVRTAEEFYRAHAPGSINIPLHEIRDIASIVPDKDTPIMLCCKSGSRASDALEILRCMGYTKLINIGTWQNY